MTPIAYPQGRACVQWGDDIWLQQWKRFARSLRCKDLLVFQYKEESYFYVNILDESIL
jgi:hypothetical protein